MKKIILFLCLPAFACSDGGQSLTSAAAEKENASLSVEMLQGEGTQPLKTAQYAEFTVFNQLFPEEGGGTALAEFSAPDEGIYFFIKEGKLYFSVSDMNLLKVDVAAGVPRLTQVLFSPFDTRVNAYTSEVLEAYRVDDLKAQRLRLACNEEGTSYVDMSPVREKDMPGLEPSLDYKLMWRRADGTTMPADCGRIRQSGSGPKNYAFCNANALYYDDLVDIGSPGAHQWAHAISRCNLNTGEVAAVLVGQSQKDRFVNPMKIPGTDYMLYFKTTSNPDSVRIYYRKIS